MTTIFPAPPGTYMVERKPDEGRTEHTPVVGYYHVQGGIVFPLCPINHGGLTRYRALLTPDGFVTDPSAGLVCASLAEWEKIADTEGYAKLKVRNGIPAPKPEADDEPADLTKERREDRDEATVEMDGVVSKEQAEQKARAAAPTRIPDKPKGKPQVFKTTSFWRMTDGSDIFQVAGGVEAPAKNDGDYQKITRDEFASLKREGADVREWPFDDDAGEAASEPEDDEDDGLDLI